jgi:hypothetical protein
MKFDVVVGNPPYQELSTVNNKQDAVYNYFYDLAESISNQYCLISPARFLFNAGLTSKTWNKKMLNDPHIRVQYYNQISNEVFSNTDIKGGVAVLYRNYEEIFGSIKNFVPDNTLREIARKFDPDSVRNLPKIMYGGRSDLKFNDLFLKDYPDSPQRRLEQIQRKHPEVQELGPNEEYELKSSTFDSLDYVFKSAKPYNREVYWEILGLYNNERTFRWIEKKYMDARYPERNNLEKWKVFVPKANGSGHFGEILSSPVICGPLTSATPTFISIGSFDKREEAENLLKYLKTKLLRALLGILKITQDNPPLKWAYIPLQDFTLNSDIDWDVSIPEIDKQLYKKYNLNQEEVDFIETKVKPME